MSSRATYETFIAVTPDARPTAIRTCSAREAQKGGVMRRTPPRKQSPVSDAPSVKFTLRMPESLRRRLAALAERDGVSLNLWLLRVLEKEGDMAGRKRKDQVDMRVLGPRVEEYFKAHPCCTGKECALALGLSANVLTRAVALVRMQWGGQRPRKPMAWVIYEGGGNPASSMYVAYTTHSGEICDRAFSGNLDWAYSELDPQGWHIERYKVVD